MTPPGSPLWRLGFLIAGVLIIAGGSLHPRDGVMALMLANPTWVLSHVLLTVGFVALLVGLALYRAIPLPERTQVWARWAFYATLLQAIETVFHTAAVVDHANLVAGRSTPVLSTHMVLTVVTYPIFGAAMIGFILASARDRVLASPWIAWLGILGAAAHGAAGLLVVGFGLPVGIGFPMLMLLALWLVIAALWPTRATGSVTIGAST